MKQIYYLVLLFFCSSISYSQTKRDSLKIVWANDKETDSIRFNAIREYYKKFDNFDIDSTLLLTEYHFKLAKNKDNVREMASALHKKAITNIRLKNYEDALEQITEAEKLAKNINDFKLTAFISGNKGIVLYHLENYSEAVKYYSKALNIYRNIKNNFGESRHLNNLGNIYHIIGNYDLALENYTESITILNEHYPKNPGRSILYLNIGAINLEKDNYKEAIANFKIAKEISENNNDRFFGAASYYSLAEAYYKWGALDSAMVNAEKRTSLMKKLNFDDYETDLLEAKIIFENDINAATKKAESLLKSSTSYHDKDFRKDMYEFLYKCYKAQKKPELSLKMHELHIIYKDSIIEKENKFAVIREAIKNDFEVQLYENKIKSEAEKAELKINELNRIYGITASSLLLIASIVFYYRTKIKRNRKKRDTLLEEINILKSNAKSKLVVDSNEFQLIREDIEASINRKLNETDWKVLNILLEEPEITNKDIAEKAYMSVDGIGSSLRRMYDYFNIKESKYKKISLLTDAIKRSNK